SRTGGRENEIDVARFHGERGIRLGYRPIRIRPRVDGTAEQCRQLRLACRPCLSGGRERKRHGTGSDGRTRLSHHSSVTILLKYAPDLRESTMNRRVHILTLSALVAASSLSTSVAQSAAPSAQATAAARSSKAAHHVRSRPETVVWGEFPIDRPPI